jgi:hypothetical protein
MHLDQAIPPEFRTENINQILLEFNNTLINPLNNQQFFTIQSEKPYKIDLHIQLIEKLQEHIKSMSINYRINGEIIYWFNKVKATITKLRCQATIIFPYERHL